MPPAPPSVPFDARYLTTGDGHRLYVEQHGRAAGMPAVVLHGGPGSGFSTGMTRPFDLRRWRVVLADQRGAGRSRPRGALEGNSTGRLIDDIERIRQALGIERWLVMGGSWGATLAVLYAARHPQAVAGMLLRGLFLARRADIDWFFGGLGALYPEAWATFAAVAPPATRSLPAWLGRRAHEPRGWARIALAWQRWEAGAAGTSPAPRPTSAALRALADKYRLQARYIGAGFDLAPDAVLRAVARLPEGPKLLLHGRDDRVCRPEGAWLARQRNPSLALQWVEGVGHDPYAPPMLAATRAALRRFASSRHFGSIGS